MINGTIFPAPACSYDLDTYPEELVHIPRADGSFTIGYLVGAPMESRQSNLIIYAHPNAVDIGMMRDDLRWVGRKTGFHALLFEFRGYGMCKGGRGPGEEEINNDMAAAYSFARNTLGVPASKIIFWGRSIGTGPTSQLASELPTTEQPALLVLEAPFTSIKDAVKTLAQRYTMGTAGFASKFVANRFATIDIISKIPCPVLIVHGKNDDIVAFSHGEKLHETAKAAGKENIRFVPLDCNHNDIPTSKTIAAMLEVLCDMPTPSAPAEPAGDARITLSVPPHLVARRSLANYAIAAKKLRRELFSAVSSTGVHGLKLRETATDVMAVSCISFAHAAAFAWQERDTRWRWEHAKTYPGSLVPIEVATPPTGRPAPASGSGVASGVANVVTGTFKAIGDAAATATTVPYKPRITVAQHVEQCLAVWGSPLAVNAVVNEECDTSAMVFGALVEPSGAVTGNAYEGLLSAMRQQHKAQREEEGTETNSRLRAPAQVPVVAIEAPRDMMKALIKAVSSLLLSDEDAAAVNWAAGEAPTPPTNTALTSEACDALQLYCERLVALLTDEQWALITSLMDDPLVPTRHGDSLSEVIHGGKLRAVRDSANCEDAAAVVGDFKKSSPSTAAIEWDSVSLLATAGSPIDGASRDGTSGSSTMWSSAVAAAKGISRMGKAKGWVIDPASNFAQAQQKAIQPRSPSGTSSSRKEDKDCVLM